MKLRQAKKIISRIYDCNRELQFLGTPLPKSWRRYMCLMHKATAVVQHHFVPYGRQANRWANEHTAKICKATKLQQKELT